ncbi:dihydrodipicolinate synthase family protein [Microbulbifer agarilyticus]|uniref:Dihydrodipicolinate synthase family protein n=1 Tax=Microbulbifer agarilyticus TaxID=260552 RepID=A0A1Q2M4G0_9GAMM|nr:dihydrodipicolinate synthase family protein [Microbulbifer agarilyticus]AQQ67613.1 dihydrodipicolinate synthase family protein [Microbulbifer agarilyticus]
MQINWSGVFPAATTQFNADESVNIAATLAHLDVMLDAGINGLVMLGTVGENCSLNQSEKIEVLAATVKHVDGRVPVLTGVSEYTTTQARAFARDAQRAGVDGLMVLPPMSYKADATEIVTHIRGVADATDLPVMVYNNPACYGVDVSAEAVADLSKIPNIVAVKEASDDPRRLTDIANLVSEDFVLFCGVDDLALESIALGAHGWISGLVNAFPQENRLMWDLATSGNFEEARKVYRWYTPLLHLDTKPKLVQYIKLAVQECGFGSEFCRNPRLNIVGEERKEVLEIIRTAIANRPTIR